MKLQTLLLFASFSLLACPSSNDDDSATSPGAPVLTTVEVPVTVTLDGTPTAGITVMQGGRPGRWTTDSSGQATIPVDLTLDAGLWVLASVDSARTGAARVDDDELDAPLLIELSAFDPSDNPAYVFRDPGEPNRRGTTAVCAHCHLTLNEDWIDSAHRHSARDVQVQDLYAGAAGEYADEATCDAAGGVWSSGPLPGGGEGLRCFVGDGVLQALNGCDGPCVEAAAFGGCADCHAPGIDGVLGGRDLRDATGHAYEYGVHCDVCHRVESVDLDAAAGTAGALRMVRPVESGAFGFPEYPLVFGPFDDVGSAVMGAVGRDHFEGATLCAGCHQLQQAVLVPGATIDSARWPSGTLPIHTTYGEWLAGPLSPGAPCQSCHMPPDPDAGNGADLTRLDLEPGLVPGWERPPGAVRHHTFDGPLDGVGEMLALAAAVDLITEVESGVLTATATVTNVGAGHAIPTGEPLRALVLVVEATCDDDALLPTSGLALSDLGGTLGRKDSSEDWSVWPGAEQGMVVRVVARPGTWLDEPGFGPFGDGTFVPEDKGMPVETVVGSATIVAMNGDVATFDVPLPPGDVAWLGEAADLTVGSPAEALAGAPGHAFARVLLGAEGDRNVAHFLAVDVASDNRLMPTASWTGAWTFAATCAAPTATAKLLYRQWPLELARERGWNPVDVVMQEASR